MVCRQGELEECQQVFLQKALKERPEGTIGKGAGGRRLPEPPSCPEQQKKAPSGMAGGCFFCAQGEAAHASCAGSVCREGAAGAENAKRAVPCEAQPFLLSMVSRARLELARRRHCHLKTACLPIPPPRRAGILIGAWLRLGKQKKRLWQKKFSGPLQSGLPTWSGRDPPQQH